MTKRRRGRGVTVTAALMAMTVPKCLVCGKRWWVMLFLLLLPQQRAVMVVVGAEEPAAGEA